MAEITAGAVKSLREKTGAGMMECKNALVEVNGNEEQAIEILRKRGLASAKKKEGRVAAEPVGAGSAAEPTTNPHAPWGDMPRSTVLSGGRVQGQDGCRWTQYHHVGSAEHLRSSTRLSRWLDPVYQRLVEAALRCRLRTG